MENLPIISTRAKCQYLHEKWNLRSRVCVSTATVVCARTRCTSPSSLLFAAIVRSSRKVYIRQADWRKTVKTHKTQDSATQLCYAMWMNTFYCFYLKKTVEHSVVDYERDLNAYIWSFFFFLFTSSAHFQHLRAAASDDDERDNDSVGVEAWWNGDEAIAMHETWKPVCMCTWYRTCNYNFNNPHLPLTKLIWK